MAEKFRLDFEITFGTKTKTKITFGGKNNV